MNAATLERPATIATLTHAHHWVIEEAHGPESEGRCKDCGATKVFRNWLPDPDFFGSDGPRLAA